MPPENVVKSLTQEPPKKEKRFSVWRTLLLLIIVIVGLGVVSFIFSYGKLKIQEDKRVDSRRIADVKQTQLALELYADLNGSYPESLSEVEDLFSLPIDPKTNTPYTYGVSSDRSDYRLRATLDDPNHIALGSDNDEDSYEVSCSEPGEYCLSPQ